MKIVRDDPHLITPRIRILPAEPEIFPCGGGLVFFVDPTLRYPISRQISGHCLRLGYLFSRPLSARDDHSAPGEPLSIDQRCIEPPSEGIGNIPPPHLCPQHNNPVQFFITSGAHGTDDLIFHKEEDAPACQTEPSCYDIHVYRERRTSQYQMYAAVYQPKDCKS